MPDQIEADEAARLVIPALVITVFSFGAGVIGSIAAGGFVAWRLSQKR